MALAGVALAASAGRPAAGQVARPDPTVTGARPDPIAALRISAVDVTGSGGAPFIAPSAPVAVSAAVSVADSTAALAPPRLPIAVERQADPARTGKMFLGGVVGAAVGMAIGMYVGYQLDRGHFHWGCERGCDDPGLWGLIGGWAFGPAATTPLAVHHANGRRGSLGRGYIASALIAGGTAGALAMEWGEIVVAAPVLHIISAVAIESDTTP